MGKQLQTAMVGLQIGWSRISGITRLEQKVWARLTETQIWLPVSFAIEEGSTQEYDPSSGRKLAPYILPQCQTTQFLLIYSCLSPTSPPSHCLNSGVQKNQDPVSACAGPLRGTSWVSIILCVTQPYSPLVFTAWSYRTSILSVELWGEELVWGWEPWFSLEASAAKVSFLIKKHHARVSDQSTLCLSALSKS